MVPNDDSPKCAVHPFNLDTFTNKVLDTFTQRSFFTADNWEDVLPPKASTSASQVAPLDPRLVKAQDFAMQRLQWDTLIRRLRTDFAHPDREMRRKFEEDSQVNVTASARENKKKQWAAAQRVRAHLILFSFSSNIISRLTTQTRM